MPQRCNKLRYCSCALLKCTLKGKYYFITLHICLLCSELTISWLFLYCCFILFTIIAPTVRNDWMFWHVNFCIISPMTKPRTNKAVTSAIHPIIPFSFFILKESGFLQSWRDLCNEVYFEVWQSKRGQQQRSAVKEILQELICKLNLAVNS